MTAKLKQRSSDQSTERAKEHAILDPQFYKTDYDALDRLDMSPVRKEWDQLMSEFERDSNIDHFDPGAEFERPLESIPEAAREEFLQFLISSLTSEFSGCILYSNIRKNVKNPDIARLMGYMARDESRHANFINRALKGFGMGVDLSRLSKEKKYKYFKPKYIYYATYLSEKIGYARYITIFRQLERNPENRFHPIYEYFEQWCNDEFRHGEAFALLMHANPKLLKGYNKLWIKFFVQAVYATMYVRDHKRLNLHAALGLNTTEYDYKVFQITSACAEQIFPLSLDIDHPAFRAGLERLRRISDAGDAAKKKGGLLSGPKRALYMIMGAATFARMYLIPSKRNELQAEVRMAPAW